MERRRRNLFPSTIILRPIPSHLKFSSAHFFHSLKHLLGVRSFIFFLLVIQLNSTHVAGKHRKKCNNNNFFHERKQKEKSLNKKGRNDDDDDDITTQNPPRWGKKENHGAAITWFHVIMLNRISWQDERGVADGRAVHEPHERRSRAKSFSTSPVASATPPEVLSWPPSQPTLAELRHIYIFARECLPKHPRCMKKKINGWWRRWYMWVLLAGIKFSGAVVCVCGLGGEAIATHHGVTLMDSLSARIWGECGTNWSPEGLLIKITSKMVSAR